ncbi:uncharacterized protein LOC130549073 isoform X1 [Triplophysa rosa]|uniref:uncharacterized protein LOC130549073 isoform X1 n=1 Tax=Triplophysa rosa TaxID=992332 RepID=UPI0025461080|nr:uncharacterized protein LOC130549073 isoform X1 [Triplophysa rosa]
MDIIIFLCFSSLIANGVFGVEVKSVSVMEGHSVTLHTDVVKQRDDKIMWYYGPENTFVARINGKANSTMLSDEEMFRDRMKMNNQTGDLTITHITSQHSGLYTLKISSNMKPTYKTFNLTVYVMNVSDETPSWYGSHKHSSNSVSDRKSFSLQRSKTETTAAASPAAPTTSDGPYSPVLRILFILFMSLLCVIPMMFISLYINGFLTE